MLLTDSNSYTNNSQVTNDILINTILFFFLYSIFFGIFFLKNWIFFLENSFSLDLESTCIFYYIFLLLFPFLPSFFSSSFSLCRIFTRFNNHLFKLISLQFPFKKKKKEEEVWLHILPPVQNIHFYKFHPLFLSSVIDF